MNSTNLLIKRSLKTFASMTRARIGFPAPAPGSVNIIAYHRVVADITRAEDEAIYGLVVSSDTFRRHCELLRKTFDVVSLETARYFLDGQRRVARPLAVITFDDGYLDFYEEAFPILNEFGLPATVFLPTNFIGQTKPLAHDRIYWLVKQAAEKSVSMEKALIRAGAPGEIAREFSPSSVALRRRSILRLSESLVYLPDNLREKIIDEMEKEMAEKFVPYPREYQLLNWDMVRETSRKGISFGAHTANHVVLTLEDDATVRQELVESKRQLEAHLNSKVETMAYPNGEYNEKIKTVVQAAGYKTAVTTEKRINNPVSDLIALGRISLCEESTRGMTGHYSAKVAALRLGA